MWRQTSVIRTLVPGNPHTSQAAPGVLKSARVPPCLWDCALGRAGTHVLFIVVTSLNKDLSNEGLSDIFCLGLTPQPTLQLLEGPDSWDVPTSPLMR